MKKSLFFVSILGLAVTAHSQSSVSLSGTVDASLTRGTGSLTSRTQLASGSNQSTKLVLRGSEDLGGGMSANFWLESGFNADSGEFQNTSSNNQPSGVGAAVAGRQGLTFNRRSIVGLRGSWGEVQAGRNWAPAYDAYTGKFDPFAVGVGVALDYAAGITQANGALRMSNSVAYITPQVFGGLSANIQYWLGENPSGAATARDGTGNGVRFNYDNGPIAAVAHWARTNYAAGNAIYRGGAMLYNFGPIKATGSIANDQQGALTAKGWMLGAWVPLGIGEMKVTYSTLHTNAAGSPEASKIAVGYVHNLSKRSAVYTTLAHVSNKNGFRQALGGATTAANESSSGFDIGVRHNF